MNCRGRKRIPVPGYWWRRHRLFQPSRSPWWLPQVLRLLEQQCPWIRLPARYRLQDRRWRCQRFLRRSRRSCRMVSHHTIFNPFKKSHWSVHALSCFLRSLHNCMRAQVSLNLTRKHDKMICMIITSSSHFTKTNKKQTKNKFQWGLLRRVGFEESSQHGGSVGSWRAPSSQEAGNHHQSSWFPSPTNRRCRCRWRRIKIITISK